MRDHRIEDRGLRTFFRPAVFQLKIKLVLGTVQYDIPQQLGEGGRGN